MYALYRSRHLLGWLPAALAAVFIAWTLQQVPLKIEPSYDAPPVQLALAEPEPEAVTPPVPVVEPPPPAPTVQSAPEPDVPPVVAEQPSAPPPPPKPRVEPKPQPKPKPRVEHHPKPVAKPQPTTTPSPTPPKVVALAPRPAPPAPPPKPAVDSGALEGGYLHGVRNDLERYKQYPSGRQASLERPSGKVVVWLLVDRTGKVLDRGLEERASSMLLNRAALTSLGRIEQVKPFPPEAFAGRSQLRITATFDYSPR
ncbi:energy transducer TonB family protein [Pseudomonas oryzihabitans]|uniref:energy transducer TonB family protein n=1 Tax=Pseudomonas oryzihabitans TaxID=47885 RepID=UPI00241D4149|nr:energy transducer TonB [Pseudomonas oryzihabitans]